MAAIQSGLKVYSIQILSKEKLKTLHKTLIFLGPDLVQPLTHSRAVQPSRNEHTLFLVGGNNNEINEVQDKTYQLVCEQTPTSCKWEETEVTLKHPRYGHVVLTIPESLALNLCNK